MLVLSRFKNESIIIGDDIVMTVVEIRSDRVRLGIEADKSIPVHRREVYEAIQNEPKPQRPSFQCPNCYSTLVTTVVGNGPPSCPACGAKMSRLVSEIPK